MAQSANAMLVEHSVALPFPALDVYVPVKISPTVSEYATRNLYVKVSNRCLSMANMSYQYNTKPTFLFHIGTACDGDKTFSVDGGTNCACSAAGELLCTETETPGCFCSIDSYLNDQGVCSPKIECHRE